MDFVRNVHDSVERRIYHIEEAIIANKSIQKGTKGFFGFLLNWNFIGIVKDCVFRKRAKTEFTREKLPNRS